VKNLLELFAVSFLFVAVSVLLIGQPWPQNPSEACTSQDIGQALFGGSGPFCRDNLPGQPAHYAVPTSDITLFFLVMLALLLATAMIGGIFLAEVEERP